MQKVVIDTNVFVSALIQKSYPYFIIYDLLAAEKIKLCVSYEVLEEYYIVFNRPKFSKYRDFREQAQNLISEIETKSLLFTPKNKITLLTDKDDNKFLELAEASKADYLITGNTNDFTIKKYKHTNIVTPKDYWENFRPYKR